MKKKEAMGSLPKASLTEAFRCSQCLHFKKHPHSQKGIICSKEGVGANAVAPRCFTPDFTKIAGNIDQFVQLAALFGSYKPEQKKILLGMLRMSSRANKKEHPFGTKVYLRLQGKDFISNYVYAFVLGYSSSGEIILSGSPKIGTRGTSFYYYAKDPGELLTEPEWKKKRKQLYEEGRINDPNVQRKFRVKDDEQERISIDTAPASWYDKTDGKKKKRRRATDELEYQV